MLGGRYPSLLPKLQEWTSLRRIIAQKTLAGPSLGDSEAHQQLLTEWNSKKEELEAELARQIPEMNLEHRLRVVNREVVVQALPPGSALVEFVRFDLIDFKAGLARGELCQRPARYLVFVLSAEEPDNVQLIDLGESESIDRMITMFRESLTGGTEHINTRHGRRVSLARHGRPFKPSRETNISDGTALRSVLFDSLLPSLGGRTQLFLVPDGELNLLPFEVLPTDDGRRLIDEYQISYLTTGRDLLRFEAKPICQSTAPLVIADPDFDFGSQRIPNTDSGLFERHSHFLSALHFRRLIGTRIEGQQIAAMLGIEPLLEKDALESKLKACQSPCILHIATNGFFLPDQKRDPDMEQLHLEMVNKPNQRLSGAGLENPLLRSGLALAGANTWLKGETLPAEAEDGILTAEDVSGLDLLATELVVLSACETGLGEVQVGEGVFGLRRAFMLAGAKTLVMSLWKVPDKQTQELMSDFYRRILAGEARAEALRQAQLAMKQKYPDPYYWGAFICQGDPSPLSRISSGA